VPRAYGTCRATIIPSPRGDSDDYDAGICVDLEECFRSEGRDGFLYNTLGPKLC